MKHDEERREALFCVCCSIHLPKWSETKTVLAHLIKVDHNRRTQTAYNKKLALTHCTFCAAVFKDVSTDTASALQPFCASNLPEQCNLNLSPLFIIWEVQLSNYK